IMDGSFCGVTTGQRGRSACGCVSKPTGMRNFRGLAAGLGCLHIHVLKLCERTLTFRGFPCGKRVRWLGWSRLTDLAQLQNFNYAEKCQELNFLRFSAVGPHP